MLFLKRVDEGLKKGCNHPLYVMALLTFCTLILGDFNGPRH